jgi:hypothetical protein
LELNLLNLTYKFIISVWRNALLELAQYWLQLSYFWNFIKHLSQCIDFFGIGSTDISVWQTEFAVNFLYCKEHWYFSVIINTSIILFHTSLKQKYYSICKLQIYLKVPSKDACMSINFKWIDCVIILASAF